MLDYTNYDYQALVDRMTEILKDKDGWGDAYQSSTGQTLIQLMADVTDHLHYMLERRTLETYLHTAKLRSSIVARASDLGYRPFRIKSHTGFVNVELCDENGDPTPAIGEVEIKAGTYLTYGDRTFFVTEPSHIEQGGTSAIVKIKEGVLTTAVFDLNTNPDVIFDNYTNIDENHFFVYNAGEEYTDVRADNNVNKRSLSFLGSEDRAYDIKYAAEGMRVVFGDGNFGKKPTGEIRIVYSTLESVGDPILTLGSEFVLSDSLVDSNNDLIVYDTRVTNISAISGGVDAEDSASIVSNAAAYHRSNGRAVTNDDYAFWLMQAAIGGIVDAKASGEEEFDSLVYNANNVYLTYATANEGENISTEQRREILEYFENIKTTQAHIVLNKARDVLLRLDVDMVRNKNVPISKSQAYRIVYDFLKEYFRVKKGSIGSSFHVSDLVEALHDIQYVNNGVTYDLVDYVRVDSDIVIPFDYPSKVSECFIEIDPDYVITDGDEFVVNLENVTCLYKIKASDNIRNVLEGMRDVIRELTPYDASVQLSGVALDAFGNPIPIEINPRVGYHLLIGVDTPYLSNTELVKPAVVGSAVVYATFNSPELEINHFYYSTPAGRRPMIPLRVGTEVTFTAPSDSDVKVYTRTDARDPSTEVFHSDLPAGETFNEVFDNDHVLIFSYESDSVEDAIANIKYPTYEGTEYGIRVRTLDNFGMFSVRTTGGDISDYINVDYKIQLPIPDYYQNSTDIAIIAGSVRITDSSEFLLFRDDGEGSILDANGVYTTGKVDYRTGVVTLPASLPPVTPTGKYLLIYDQDRYESVRVGSSDVIRYILPPLNIDSTVASLSSLKVS